MLQLQKTSRVNYEGSTMNAKKVVSALYYLQLT